MLMQTKSISDTQLLWQCGFYELPVVTDAGVSHRPDVGKIATFCGVSERTVRHWLKRGLPKQPRTHMENLLAGDYLPMEWRRAGIKITHDRLYLYCGSSIPLQNLQRWPFLMKCLDYDKLAAIYPVQQSCGQRRALPAQLKCT